MYLYSFACCLGFSVSNIDFFCLGQHNDARMNIAIALTAARMGATLANHTEVLDLIKFKNEEGEEEVRGARLRDRMSGEKQLVLSGGWCFTKILS